MEKELLKKLVTNWTNPERIALLDSGVRKFLQKKLEK
jgi:hypothetical protein